MAIELQSRVDARSKRQLDHPVSAVAETALTGRDKYSGLLNRRSKESGLLSRAKRRSSDPESQRDSCRPLASALQQDRLLQKLQRFQLVQSTRACFACERFDQGFGNRLDTVKIVQARHGRGGHQYGFSLG